MINEAFESLEEINYLKKLVRCSVECRLLG